MFESFQSGLRAQHITETAFLKAMSDLLLAADALRPSILVLLDLNAAFDTADHTIFC